MMKTTALEQTHTNVTLKLYGLYVRVFQSVHSDIHMSATMKHLRKTTDQQNEILTWKKDRDKHAKNYYLSIEENQKTKKKTDQI